MIVDRDFQFLITSTDLIVMPYCWIWFCSSFFWSN